MKFPALISKILMNYFRWLAAAVVVIIVFFGYVGFISAKIQKIRITGYLEQRKVQTELNNRQQFLAAMRDSVSRFNAALPADKLQAIDDFIPSSPDFPGLLLTVRNIASAANLDLDSISVGASGQLAATGPTASAEETADATSTTAKAAAAAGVNLQVQDATITVGGGQSYQAFKNFVALIESSRRLLDVVSLSFTLGGDVVGQAAQGDYTLQLRTYYLPSAAAE